MKHPMGFIVVPYITGLLLADCLEFDLPVLFGFAAFLAAAVALSPVQRANRLLPLFLVACGMTALTASKTVIHPNHLLHSLSDRPELATLRGTLNGPPLLKVEWEDNGGGNWRSMARLEVVSIQTQGDRWRPASGSVMVTYPDRMPEMRDAAKVEVFGVLSRPPTPIASGLFDYREYLERKSIYHVLKTEGSGDWRILVDGKERLSDRFTAWARGTLGKGFPETDRTVPLLWAMALGWRTALNDTVSEPFMKSGTMHLFAISGLHIALISGILIRLMRVMRLPREWCGAIAVPAIWFYTAATGWQSSAVRASIMLTIVIGGWALRRPRDLLNSLAAAALVILLWEPQQLFMPGFQLSFAVVGSIAVLLPPMERFRSKALRTDPMLPPELRPRWRRWLDDPLNFLTGSAMISLAAWLGAMPLGMQYFHLVTPVGLLANVVVVHLGAAALASCLGCLMTTPVVPAIGDAFNHSAWFLMNAMTVCSEWAADLPGAWRYTKPPPLLFTMAYYAGLIVLGTCWTPGRRRHLWLLLVAAAAMVGAWHLEYRHPRLTVLPLQGGHAVFLDQPGWKNDWLIDCGDSASYEFVTRPFLISRGVQRLSGFVLSHGDVRHMGAATNLVDEFEPSLVASPDISFRSTVYRQTLKWLDGQGTSILPVARGETLGPWTVLHPERDLKVSHADFGSLALAGTIAGIELRMFTDYSDARMLLEGETGGEILISGLAEETSTLPDSLLERNRGSWIVLADDRYPAGAGAPDAEVWRLGRGGQLLQTSEHGAVELIIQNQRVRIRGGRTGPIQ